MSQKKLYLSIYSLIIFCILLFSLFIIKIDCVKMCLFTKNDNQTSLVVTKSIHDIIDNKYFKYCYIDINKHKTKATLTFNAPTENNLFVYWIYLLEDISIDNISYYTKGFFGSQPIINIIF